MSFHNLDDAWYSNCKPYTGAMKQPEATHGLTAEQITQRTIDLQLPFLFSSKDPFRLGTKALWFDGTQGSCTRLVTREEFLEWEQKLFGPCETFLDDDDKYFVEVTPD